MNSRKYRVAPLSEQILGKTVTIQLRRFLLPIITSKYDYVILMSRKMYTLFRTYFDDNFNKFFSSDAIDIIGTRFSGKAVLVVDDTMIHGRTLESAKQQILHFNAKQVDFQVFVKEEYSDTPPPVSEVYTDAGECFSFSKPEWRSFSSNLISLFESTLTPYRRALPYMYIEVDSTQREQFFTELKSSQYTFVAMEDEAHYQGETASSVFFGYPISKQTSHYCGAVIFKLSWSDGIPDTILITPYVFMKNMLRSVVEEALVSIVSKEHLCASPADQGRLLQFLTAYQALCDLSTLVSQLGLKYELDTSDYRFAFARNDFPQINTLPNLSSYHSENVDYPTILGSYLTSISSSKEEDFSLERFFMYAGIIDDANVWLSNRRTCFIMLSQCLKQVTSFVDYVKLLSKGIAAMSYQTFDSDRYLCPCLAPGELAFSYASENYQEIQNRMYVFSDLSMEHKFTKEQSNEMYRKLFTLTLENYPSLKKELIQVIDFCCSELCNLTDNQKNLTREQALHIAARYISECIPSLKKCGSSITSEVLRYLQNYK